MFMKSIQISCYLLNNRERTLCFYYRYFFLTKYPNNSRGPYGASFKNPLSKLLLKICLKATKSIMVKLLMSSLQTASRIIFFNRLYVYVPEQIKKIFHESQRAKIKFLPFLNCAFPLIYIFRSLKCFVSRRKFMKGTQIRNFCQLTYYWLKVKMKQFLTAKLSKLNLDY